MSLQGVSLAAQPEKLAETMAEGAEE